MQTVQLTSGPLKALCRAKRAPCPLCLKMHFLNSEFFPTMKTTRLLKLILIALALPLFAHAQMPPLPDIIPYYDAKAYAWVWKDAQWTLIPRNEARVLNHEQGNSKQLTGTLWIDGCYDVPVVSGQNVLLAFRKKGDFRTFEGQPAGGSAFEVVKLDVQDGPRKGQLIRTAQLQRLGESAATFGAKREPVTVWQQRRADGVFHVVQVNRPLAPGRYAFYLPDRAFEFEVR